MPVFPVEELPPGEPGALINASAYGYEFRNFRFGAGTDFIVEKVEGLLGMPSVRENDVDRANNHGAHPGLLLLNKRTVQFDIKVMGGPGLDIEGKLRDLRRVFQVPRRRLAARVEPFVYSRPGEPKKVLYVRCTRRDIDSTYRTARGIAEGSVELVAPDPRIYSLEVHSAQAAAINDIPGSVVVTNEGDMEDGALPVITIQGPALNPIVQNVDDDNRQVKFNINLGANDRIRVDLSTLLVEKNIGDTEWVPDWTILATDTQWWALLPGSNTIRLLRANNVATAATMTVVWQDSWQ